MMEKGFAMSIDLKKTGKVYLAGAGPSDIGLLTLKTLQILKKAQTVIYDALIGPAVQGLIPHHAEQIPVGKRAGRHSMKQEEINRLIVEKALEGRLVVRLKGGDPFLFGRGAEEVQALLEHGIEYEIIPGVPSAVSVPAYAGIPVTCRGMSSAVHILTGHKKQDEPLDIDFKALTRAGGTYVFLMGMSSLQEIADGFLKAGMEPGMPAAVIEQGTGARQRTIPASLQTLKQEAYRHHAAAPAVIVIGKTAAFAKEFCWYEKLPLFGCRILVTRPAARSRRLSGMLRELGAEVIEMPAICTRKRDCAGAFLKELSRIREYRYLVFTSPAGVDYFFELLENLDLDIRCIGNIRLAVIGSATKDALRKHGLKPELMPERYNGAALGKLLNQSLQDGEKVLILRSAMGSEELVKEIQAGKQIQVTDLAIYDTVYTAGSCAVQGDAAGFHTDSGVQSASAGYGTGSGMQSASAGFGTGSGMQSASAGFGTDCLPQKTGSMETRLIQDGRADMVMFTSASTVRGFVQMTEGWDYAAVRAVCIGKMTADQAAFYGMQVHLAEKETIESMTEAALKLHRNI